MVEIQAAHGATLVNTIQGYIHTIVFVNAAPGYRCIYGMKTEDDAIKVLRRCYSGIADLRTKHKLVVLMRDNASEYKSEEMMQFLESNGIRSHFSTPKEQWQNVAAESTINVTMMIARTVMAESGLEGRFWFKAASAGKYDQNVTSKERIGMTPYQAMFGEKSEV